MDALLVKYITGQASAEEQAQVHQWLNAGAGNQTYFNQFVSIWQESKKAGVLIDVDTDAAWLNFRSQYIQAPVKKIPSGYKTRFLQVAAAVILAVAGSWLAYTFVFKEAQPLVALQTTVTGTEVKIDTLPDHSVVTLNKSSALSYATQMKGSERKVALKGEAFFDIKPDAARPFLIEAYDIQIKVLGTSFNVKTSEAATEIIVRSGRVEVNRGGDKVILTAGQKLDLVKGMPAAEATKEPGELYSYYVSKTFVCDNTPLWKLVEKLNEVYGVHIVIERKELAALPLNVSFNDESLDTILDIISQTLMLKVDKKGSDIFLR